jgi:soluble lytic murein transglycosylase-like protein
MRGSLGQASVLLVGGLLAVVAGGAILAVVARGLGVRGEMQSAADLGAVAGARAMHDAYARLFEPPAFGLVPNPRHLGKEDYLALGRVAAERLARRNGAERVRIEFPDAETMAPVRIRVRAERTVKGTRIASVAEAELAPPSADGMPAFASGGGYDGPLAYRQGKPLRPDVAQAFDRMARAAGAAGVALALNSGFRSDADQAVLWARNPDPRWVARPGHSLHRNATELDVGPDAAYGWLAANARRFGFLQRYSWEPWHYGFVLNARSRLRWPAAREGGERGAGSAVPSFVPRRYAGMLAAAAQRWNVSSALLAAQIHAESNFNPFAVSEAGARGLAQFMPGTARAYGLHNPHDPKAALDAQARHMRDLLRRFGSVPLALAAYNAGPARVAACGCIPPISETRGYVARILGLIGGAGDVTAGASGFTVRLVA